MCSFYFHAFLLPCIDIHLTKITQLISGNVHGDFSPQWHTPFTLLRHTHTPSLHFFQGCFLFPFDTFHMVMGHRDSRVPGGPKAPAPHPMYTTCSPESLLLQKFLPSVCSRSEKVKYLLSKNVFSNPAWSFFYVSGFRCSFLQEIQC